MREIGPIAFKEFEHESMVLIDDIKKKRVDTRGSFSPVRFRGQAGASWQLQTTLERYSNEQYSPEDYYDFMRSIRPAVESWTDKRWPFNDNYEHDDSVPGAPQGYDFMVYLRHHGFPSPLLDWTESFYVAAFFAFRTAQDKEDNVAIYSFIEYCGEGKTGWGGKGRITGVGPYVRTHKRHFLQQCDYTFCTKRLKGGKYVYCSHEEVFNGNDGKQDKLTKYIIPKTERTNVLEKLYMMNITAHSLFGNEESLLETLAYKEIVKKR